MTSEGAALFRRAVMSDLRSHAPLEDALYRDTDALDPPSRIHTPMSRPSRTLPATLVVDVYAGGGTGTNHTVVDVSFVVEAGLTVTQGWREHHNDTAGTNADLVADEIMDAVSERANVSFGTALRHDGRFGGGSPGTPGEGGEMNRVSQWQYRLGRNLNVGPYG